MITYNGNKQDKLSIARHYWKEFEDIPMNPETECMEAPFLSFPAGTHREEIWHWFEKEFGVSVAKDLM